MDHASGGRGRRYRYKLKYRDMADPFQKRGGEQAQPMAHAPSHNAKQEGENSLKRCFCHGTEACPCPCWSHEGVACRCTSGSDNFNERWRRFGPCGGRRPGHREFRLQRGCRDRQSGPRRGKKSDKNLDLIKKKNCFVSTGPHRDMSVSVSQPALYGTGRECRRVCLKLRTSACHAMLRFSPRKMRGLRKTECLGLGKRGRGFPAAFSSLHEVFLGKSNLAHVAESGQYDPRIFSAL